MYWPEKESVKNCNYDVTKRKRESDLIKKFTKWKWKDEWISEYNEKMDTRRIRIANGGRQSERTRAPFEPSISPCGTMFGGNSGAKGISPAGSRGYIFLRIIGILVRDLPIECELCEAFLVSGKAMQRICIRAVTLFLATHTAKWYRKHFQPLGRSRKL